MQPEVRQWIGRAHEAEMTGKKVFLSYLCCIDGHYTPKGVNCLIHGRQRFNVAELLDAHGLADAKTVFSWGSGRGNES